MDSNPSSMSICVLVDISKNAIAYGKQVGIYDKTLVWDLNEKLMIRFPKNKPFWKP
jgi:hypothetical protein